MADPAVLRDVEIAKVEAGKLAGAKPVKTEDDVTAAKAQITEIKRVRKNIVEQREAANRPLRVLVREHTDLFQEPINTLKDAEDKIRKSISKFRGN